jgi:predicted nucleic acid-binding protein
VTTFILDASALVKAYHRERGHHYVRGLVDSPDSLCLVLSISLAETLYVFARLLHDKKRISPEELRQYNGQLLQDVARGRIQVEDVDGELALKTDSFGVIDKAWRLLGVPAGKRPYTLDCLVAAFGCEVRHTGASVVCADDPLNQLLHSLGLPAINPEHHS